MTTHINGTHSAQNAHSTMVRSLKDRMDCVDIPDTFEGFDKRHFCIPSHYHEGLGNVVLTYGMLRDRIQKLARDMFTDFVKAGRTKLMVICVLRGGSRFFNDLLENLDKLNTAADGSGGQTIDITIEFIRVKSYKGDESSGSLQLVGNDSWERMFSGKHVLLVEDVIDTGLTMVELLKVIEGYSTKSLTVTALTKKRRPEVEYWPDYCGFLVPSKHIVGYNYDFNNHYRDMAHVCFLGEEAKKIYPKEA